MKAFFIMSMILEIEDDLDLEESRASMEATGWNSLIQTMKSGFAENEAELTQEDVDTVVLFYGVQAWPLPHQPSAVENER